MAPLLLRLLATSMTRLSQTSSSLSSAYRGLRTLTVARMMLPSPSPVNAPASLPASARHEPSLLGQCRHLLPSVLPSAGMKTKSALKRRCKDCFFVRRRGRLFVFCKTHPRHKQRQG